MTQTIACLHEKEQILMQLRQEIHLQGELQLKRRKGTKTNSKEIQVQGGQKIRLYKYEEIPEV